MRDCPMTIGYPGTPTPLDDQPPNESEMRRREAKVQEIARDLLPHVRTECKGTTRIELAFGLAVDFVDECVKRNKALNDVLKQVAK